MTLSYFTDKIPAVVDAALHMIIAAHLICNRKKTCQAVIEAASCFI